MYKGHFPLVSKGEFYSKRTFYLKCHRHCFTRILHFAFARAHTSFSRRRCRMWAQVPLCVLGAVCARQTKSTPLYPVCFHQELTQLGLRLEVEPHVFETMTCLWVCFMARLEIYGVCQILTSIPFCPSSCSRGGPREHWSCPPLPPGTLPLPRRAQSLPVSRAGSVFLPWWRGRAEFCEMSASFFHILLEVIMGSGPAAFCIFGPI